MGSEVWGKQTGSQINANQCEPLYVPVYVFNSEKFKDISKTPCYGIVWWVLTIAVRDCLVMNNYLHEHIHRFTGVCQKAVNVDNIAIF